MDPLVSVFTITYNHAPYIKRCIEGVLMQKTTFPFEYLIGEDCSTDGTREIVLDYASQYPDKIRIITSNTNVGARQNSRRTRLAAKGEFFAFCEGDDYWIDPLKLQKQYDAIHKYEAILLVHNTIVLSYQEREVTGIRLKLLKNESGFLSTEDIILKADNFHLSSIFIRSEVFKDFPDWYLKAPVGDVPLKMVAASMGKVYYINEIMSVYQKGLPGSYTADERRRKKSFDENQIKFARDYLEMYKSFDAYTNHKYRAAVRERSNQFLEKQIFDNNFPVFLDIDNKYMPAISFLVNLLRPAPRKLVSKMRNKIASIIVDSIYKNTA